MSHEIKPKNLRTEELTIWGVGPTLEQTSKDVSSYSSLSPMSFLDFPSDLDLGLEFSSLQPEIGIPAEARNSNCDMDADTTQSHHSSQPFAPDSPGGRSGGQSERKGESELNRTPQGPHVLSSSASPLLVSYSKAPSSHSRSRLSLARDMAPKSLSCQPQKKANVHLMSFDQQEVTALSTDSEDTGTDSGYGKSVSSRPRSSRSQLRRSHHAVCQSTKPIADPVMTSWIRNLSNINVELHQHMLSIPPIATEQSTPTNTTGKRTSNGSKSSKHDQELAVDCTFSLSQQYTDILKDLFSRHKTRQAYHERTAAALVLDEPSQLLILSSYFCLVESYDKIIQHIGIWTEVRSKPNTSTSDEHFPIRLPSLAIGSFKLHSYSSTLPLVLTCMIEAVMRQIHDLINDMMNPMNTRNGTAGLSSGAAGVHGTGNGDGDADGLSGVAKVTLQAIRAKEDSTLKLIRVVWKRALQCGVS